jgi:DEAD/DEAH box helicase domain-containing protein
MWCKDVPNPAFCATLLKRRKGELRQILFDLETQRWSNEVEGGWNNVVKFGLSVAVSWDDENGFRRWLENDVGELVNELARADKIIGFNVLAFDYEVLRAYVPTVHELLDERTFDILVDLEARLGFRLSLKDICSATLGRSKIGSGKEAVEWFRRGQVEKAMLYCQKDVELTRNFYKYGQEHGLIYYPRMGRLVEAQVDW